jgi:integrase
VLPAFEHFALREITVRKVDHLLKDLRKLSYNRARKAKTVLRLAFGLAVRWEVLDRNPVQGVERLHRPPHQAKALSGETIEILRVALAEFQAGSKGKPGPKPDPQIPVIIEVMLGTSARIGEVLALRRVDIDLESQLPTVRIAGTVIQVGRTPVHRQDHPKTAKSNRTVTIPKFAAEALATHLARIGEVEPDRLIFSTRRGTPMSTNNFRRALATQLKGSAVGHVTPHAFRRTVATTIDRARGIQLAAELLGHSNSEITRIHYIEPNSFVNPTTADILEAALGTAESSVKVTGTELAVVPGSADGVENAEDA